MHQFIKQNHRYHEIFHGSIEKIITYELELCRARTHALHLHQSTLRSEPRQQCSIMHYRFC